MLATVHISSPIGDASLLQSRDASPAPRHDAKSSSSAGDDASRSAENDASLPAASDGRSVCTWCRRPIENARRDAVFCSKRCRQTAWRLRKRLAAGVGDGSARRFAYADPPYPGMAAELYRSEATYAGEVDHAALIASLGARYDGWALSTGAYALRQILPLCPADARVCAWVKPIGVSRQTFGLHNAWEPLIVKPGRKLQPGVRDWLAAQPARRGGTLIGRKPIAFAAFLFAALGMLPGDSLDDLFPGTGIITRAWNETCRGRSSATV